MSLADQIVVAIRAVEEDGEAVIEIRDYYIKNHVKRRYIDVDHEILLFNDGSLFYAKNNGKGGASFAVVEHEDLKDFLNEFESIRGINNRG